MFEELLEVVFFVISAISIGALVVVGGMTLYRRYKERED